MANCDAWVKATALKPGAIRLIVKPPWNINAAALVQGDEEAKAAYEDRVARFVRRVWQDNTGHAFVDVGAARARWETRASLTASLWKTVTAIGNALGYPEDVVLAMTEPILLAFAVNPLRALFAYRMLLLLWGITPDVWRSPGWATAVGDDVDTWVEHARAAFFRYTQTNPETGADESRMVQPGDVYRRVPPRSVATAPRTDLGWLTDGVPPQIAALFRNEVRHVNATSVFSPGARHATTFTAWNVRGPGIREYTIRRTRNLDSPQVLARFLFEDQTVNTGGGVFTTVLPAGALNPAPAGAMSWMDRVGVDGAPSAGDGVDTNTTMCLLVVAYSMEHWLVRSGIAPYDVGICDAVDTCPLPPTVATPRNLRIALPLLLTAHLNGGGATETMSRHLSDVRGMVGLFGRDDDGDGDPDVLARNNSTDYWANKAPARAADHVQRPVPKTDSPNTRRLVSQSLSEDADDADCVVPDFGGVEHRRSVLSNLFGPPTPDTKPKAGAKTGAKTGVETGDKKRGKKRVQKGPGSDSDSDSDGGAAAVPGRKRRVVVDDSDSE